MNAQIKLTKRFTAEFSIRPYLIADRERSLALIYSRLNHKSNHVRRLCSEGTRSRLPWGINIPPFIQDPSPVIPILGALKNDNSLYVRRSVANSLGDIAKDHPDLVFDLCTQCLKNSDANLRWLIRHAVRYHVKKSHPRALELRSMAKR
jgi:3-methyladenine DNA glycosylase AlkC